MKVQHACRTEAGPSSTPPSTPTGSRSPEVPIPRMLGAGSDVGRGAGGPDVRCRGRSTRLATAGLPRGGDLDRTMHAQPLPVDHPRVPRRVEFGRATNAYRTVATGPPACRRWRPLWPDRNSGGRGRRRIRAVSRSSRRQPGAAIGHRGRTRATPCRRISRRTQPLVASTSAGRPHRPLSRVSGCRARPAGSARRSRAPSCRTLPGSRQPAAGSRRQAPGTPALVARYCPLGSGTRR